MKNDSVLLQAVQIAKAESIAGGVVVNQVWEWEEKAMVMACS